jgi:amidohydrolase
MSIQFSPPDELNKYIISRNDYLVAFRRDLHAHPEIAFREHRTAGRVAEKLRALGLDVQEGLAGTGVVGVLSRGSSPRMIGLRADMDALAMEELNDIPHRSRNAGLMHGCGHDGHTAMLLGAAEYLARHGRFDGTIAFVFQPAEENLAGAGVMVREGFFDRFPVESIFGLHNRPQMRFGTFALPAGPMMASADNFGITIRAHGGHAGSPHLAVDGVVIAAEIILSLQTIASRHTDPLDAAVVSVTRLLASESDNVLADEVTLRGTARALRVEVQDRIEALMRRMAQNIADMHGASAEVTYERRYPPLVNDPAEAARAAHVAAALVGAENVNRAPAPSMGSDDFSWFGRERPSAFIWLGTGPVERGRYLHNPRYDFNDAAIPLGVAYWVRLAETALAPP